MYSDLTTPLILPFLPSRPQAATVMSAADVLYRLLKLNLSAPESRRVLNNFLHFEGYGYFVSTLGSSDVLSFVNLLDKVRMVAGGPPGGIWRALVVTDP